MNEKIDRLQILCEHLDFFLAVIHEVIPEKANGINMKMATDFCTKWIENREKKEEEK